MRIATGLIQDGFRLFADRQCDGSMALRCVHIVLAGRQCHSQLGREHVHARAGRPLKGDVVVDVADDFATPRHFDLEEARLADHINVAPLECATIRTFFDDCRFVASRRRDSAEGTGLL